MPYKLMNKIFCVILVSFVISGCPATFSGLVKNESSYEIVVLPPFKTEHSWIIESGDKRKVSWYQECITIKRPSGVQYFSGWPIPKGVVTNGLFSSTLEVVYKHGDLFFKNNEGQLLKINEVATCGKA